MIRYIKFLLLHTKTSVQWLELLVPGSEMPVLLRTGHMFGRAGKIIDYVSTRGQAPVLDFEAATLTGLTSDGGLYVPAAWPVLSEGEIEALCGLSQAGV